MTSEQPPERDDRLRAGVIGVGHMGAHHARIYSELRGVELVGISDLDDVQARSVADRYGTRVLRRDELLEAVDMVSIAVPTPYHYTTTRECLEQGVHVLVEKPFVDDIERGHELVQLAAIQGLTLQVGHVERFNPAVAVLRDIIPDMDIVAVDIQRLGPPVDRGISDSVVMDLMIHDIDLLLWLVGSDIESLSAVARDDRHAVAQFRFENGSVATLTASRLTQQKVRQLFITTTECRINVDFISQTVEIHRRTLPEYIETDGEVRYRQESVTERPMVTNGEPLRSELEGFAHAVRTRSEPAVTGEQALRVLEVAQRIEQLALPPRTEVISS